MKYRLCDKQAVPGKVYCRNHLHGNENNNSHDHRYGKNNENLRERRSGNKKTHQKVS